jgi:maleylpyruvate isomerase
MFAPIRPSPIIATCIVEACHVAAGSGGATVAAMSDLDEQATIDGLDRSQRVLDEHLASVEELDPSAPSLLPGWTLAHVLTHIARNADSILRMLSGLPQYWMGSESRTSDIELGSRRSWPELVDDVATTSAAVTLAMRQVANWGGTVQGITGERPKQMLPALRRREVELHRIDLGIGYGFADLPHDFVRTDSHLLEMLWKARQPMGLTPLPESVLAVPEYQRLAWLSGRLQIDGVGPARVF